MCVLRVSSLSRSPVRFKKCFGEIRRCFGAFLNAHFSPLMVYSFRVEAAVPRWSTVRRDERYCPFSGGAMRLVEIAPERGPFCCASVFLPEPPRLKPIDRVAKKVVEMALRILRHPELQRCAVLLDLPDDVQTSFYCFHAGVEIPIGLFDLPSRFRECRTGRCGEDAVDIFRRHIFPDVRFQAMQSAARHIPRPYRAYSMNLSLHTGRE